MNRLYTKKTRKKEFVGERALLAYSIQSVSQPWERIRAFRKNALFTLLNCWNRVIHSISEKQLICLYIPVIFYVNINLYLRIKIAQNKSGYWSVCSALRESSILMSWEIHWPVLEDSAKKSIVTEIISNRSPETGNAKIISCQ